MTRVSVKFSSKLIVMSYNIYFICVIRYENLWPMLIRASQQCSYANLAFVVWIGSRPYSNQEHFECIYVYKFMYVYTFI